MQADLHHRSSVSIETGSQTSVLLLSVFVSTSMPSVTLRCQCDHRPPMLLPQQPLRRSSLLASYAAALGVKHMIQGHHHNDVKFADGAERHTGEMFQRWGLLFLIDVGMSREIGDSQGAALKITRERAVAVWRRNPPPGRPRRHRPRPGGAMRAMSPVCLAPDRLSPGIAPARTAMPSAGPPEAGRPERPRNRDRC